MKIFIALLVVFLLVGVVVPRVVLAHNTFPSYDQTGFRFYDQDGTSGEDESGWGAGDTAQDTNITGLAKSSPFILRFDVTETANQDQGASITWEVEYQEGNVACTAGGTWVQITTTSTDFELVADTQAIYADGATMSTNRLTGEGRGFSGTGYHIETDTSRTTVLDFDSDETQWSIQATTNATDSAVYTFRVSNGGSALNTYSVCAQATMSSGGATPPTVTSNAATGVTSSTATINGEITATGGENANERGFAWGTNSSLSGGDTATTTEFGSFGTGTFSDALSSLSSNTTYYFRAYAANTAGTSTGSILNFTTSAGPPTITTNAATNVSNDTGTVNLTVTSDGGSTVTTAGFAWGTNSSLSGGDTATTSNTVSLTDSGTFAELLSNLTKSTTYYFRAYGTNTGGTGFGSISNFTTEGATTSTALVPGRMGQAIKFDGEDDFIDIGASESTINTVAFWVRAASSTASMEIVDFNGTAQIEFNASSEITATGFTSPTVYVDGSSASAVINDTEWHHVVVTTGTDVNASDLDIGRAETQGNFHGSIDDFRLYDRVLTKRQVNRLYGLGATTKVAKTVAQSNLLNSGLDGHWTFDGDALDLTAVTAEILDKSVNALHGNWLSHGTTTAPGVVGQAIEFDGVDDAIDLGGTTDLRILTGASYTIASWINLDSLPSTDERYTIISKYAYEPGDPGFDSKSYWYGLTTANRVAFCKSADSSTCTDQVDSTKTYTVSDLGVWYHVAISSDTSGNFTHYRNGEQTTTGSFANTTYNSGLFADPYIGAVDEENGGTAPDFFFDGKLDDVRFYDRELSKTEVARLYELGATTRVGVTLGSSNSSGALSNGLISHWTFDGPDVNIGTNTIVDSAGSADGTTFGMDSATTTIIGVLGQAMDFDGSDDYVDVGNVSSGVQTIALWIKTNVNTNAGIVDLNTGTNWLQLTIGSVFDLSNDASETIYIDGVQTTSYPSDGEWHHVVVLPSSAINVSDLDIGRRSTVYFAGSFDDVRLYDRGLSVSEVQQLYDLGR